MYKYDRAFWAKKQDVRGQFEWLPLTQHLKDVGDVAGLLWEHWLCEGQKQLIRDLFAEEGEEKGKGLVQFLGAIHDIGKATPAFQIKQGYFNTPDLDARLIEKLEADGYHDISNLLLASISSSPHALASQHLLSSYGVGEDIASIIGAHHGKPVDDNRIVTEQASYASNYFQHEDPSHPVGKQWREAQEMIFHKALQSGGFNQVEDLPEIPQPAQVILAGLVIMADWIASNERFFPLLPIDIDEVVNSEDRLQKGWETWKKTDIWQPQRLQSVERLYQDRFNFKPRNVQAELSRAIDVTDEPGIIILEAPMGIGKTEAAFIAVEQLAQKTGRSGMFFGLPTQATSNGIFPRVHSWLEKVRTEVGDNVSIRLAHGKSALNPQFTDLAKHINVDSEQDGSVVINDWFAGRKTSALDDFVVGTVDHFLLIALKQKHLALRHLGFSKKVVVIDEVHAYDAYMNQYLLKALRWMAVYGVPVVILSATLPSERRHEMVRAYLRGKGARDRMIRERLTELPTSAYPLITYTDGVDVRQVVEFAEERKKIVQIRRSDTESVLELLDNWMQGNGVFGIIVNTVKRAQELASACVERYGHSHVELLHSRFIDTDRVRKEESLLSMIGKGADRPEKKIIIGTQVMEQSLDIDLDVLVTDLAPMDLIIQRIGRLHRHNILRPKAHKEAVCYVLDTDSNFAFEKGSVAIYGAYLLARTQSFLPEVMVLPGDISRLVQKVYGEDPVEMAESLQNLYEEMRREHENRIASKNTRAKTYRIAAPVLQRGFEDSGSLIGWLRNKTPLETEEKAYAQVRDIQETIEVIVLQKRGEGYGIVGEDGDISDHIDDPQIASDIARQTLRLPNGLSKPYTIDATIKELETYHALHFSDWYAQPWLKGALGIILDENLMFELNGMKLQYNLTLGLLYERM